MSKIGVNEIFTEISSALDKAQNIWNKVKDEFIVEASRPNILKSLDIDSDIPGHRSVNPDVPEVGQFIAFVLDIRDSSIHLTQAIDAKVSQLERVYYETTAINTLGGLVMSEYDGSITEYLGDGFLALFLVKDEKEKSVVSDASNAANEIIENGLLIVNNILKMRYSLPPLSVGIGMAYSKAVVTTVGYGGQSHPKAIGQCVFRAAKLSDGIDAVRVDDCLEHLWPTGKNPKISFRTIGKYDFKGFELSRLKRK